MNSRKEIIIRNRKYLDEYLNMTENEWFNLLRDIGKPDNHGQDWSYDNPTCGWCGGVTNALRLSGRVPDGFIACRHKFDGHFYMINPTTKEVIDLTIYQNKGEYKHDYSLYIQKFMNVLSKNVKKILQALDLKIDKTKFTLYRKPNYDYIRKV